MAQTKKPGQPEPQKHPKQPGLAGRAESSIQEIQEQKEPASQTPGAKSKSLSSNIMDGAVIVALATVIGYAQAYLYDYAHSLYFGIPISFISVSVENVCFCAFITFLFIVISLMIWPLYRQGFVELGDCVKEARKKPVYIVVFQGIYYLIASVAAWRLSSFETGVGVFLFFAVALVVEVFLLKKKIGVYVGIALSIIVLFGLPIMVGYTHARYTIDFLVDSDHPDYAMLAVFKDKAILGRIDPKTNIIGADYQVAPLDGKTWSWRRFGNIAALSSEHYPRRGRAAPQPASQLSSQAASEPASRPASTSPTTHFP